MAWGRSQREDVLKWTTWWKSNKFQLQK